MATETEHCISKKTAKDASVCRKGKRERGYHLPSSSPLRKEHAQRENGAAEGKHLEKPKTRANGDSSTPQRRTWQLYVH